MEYAKHCIKKDDVDKARKSLGEKIKDYPVTKADEVAAKLLKELDAKKD